jgi:hypothetical protein
MTRELQAGIVVSVPAAKALLEALEQIVKQAEDLRSADWTWIYRNRERERLGAPKQDAMLFLIPDCVLKVSELPPHPLFCAAFSRHDTIISSCKRS